MRRLLLSVFPLALLAISLCGQTGVAAAKANRRTAPSVFAYSFGMDPPNIERTEFYSADGKLLRAATRCSNFNRRRIRCGGTKVEDFIEEYPKMLYLKPGDLPFYNLPRKGR